MKLTKEKLIERVQSFIGDRTDDESLSLLEDISDSMGEDTNEDWHRKFEENDKLWRERYKKRFSGEIGEEEEVKEEDEKEERKTYDALFI